MSDAPVAPKKSSSRRRKTETPEVTTTAVVSPTPVVTEVAPVVTEPEQTTSRRRSEQKAQHLQELSQLLLKIKTDIELDIERRRNAPSDNKGNKGIKFLKSVNKSVKRCSMILNRVNKTKKARRTGNTKSGFSIPVEVSAEMSNFAKWEVGEHKSRVDVTRVICDYIRTHNLQNEADRRIIVPDAALTNLLKYDPTTMAKLTYYNLQKLIQPHFPRKKSDVVAPVPVVAST